MKRRYLLWAVPCLSFLLTGCAQDRLAPLDRNIKPALHYWEKNGVTQEERRQDSASCGGGSNDQPGFSQTDINATRQPGDKDDFAPRARLVYDWQRCMLSHGYRYTGKCYDNEIGRASPACAERVLEPVR